MKLKTGVVVRCVEPSDLWRPRLDICSGLARALGNGFVEKACVPRDDWRMPTPDELDTLDAGNAVIADESEGVVLWKLPADLFAHFQFIGDALRLRNQDHVARNLVTTTDFQRASDHVLDCLRSRGFDASAKLLGHCVNPPGLSTLGLDGHNRFVGVHIDNYVPQGVENRTGFPNRLCVNIGPEARYLLFSNLTMNAVQRDIGVAGIVDSVAFQNVYYDHYSEYPLFRLRVEPGEAYIAPTQTIMHEGSTMKKSFFDVQVTFLGEFAMDRLRALPTDEIHVPVDNGRQTSHR